jgi:adenylate cyclase
VLGERRRQRLAGYVPTRRAEALASADRPAFEGQRQAAAVIFVDLAGFTGRSEAGGPEATVALLRQLHADFEEIATAHDGYVDSFSGDGAMLVFGVPQPGADDADNAVRCARALLARGDKRGMELRVGLHYGEVQVARLGGRHQHQLTLAGDAVNLASRLMDVAKENGAVLAMSEAVAAALRQHGKSARLADLEYRPAQAIRGRSGLIDVWLAPREQPE